MMIPERVRNALSLLAFNVLMEILNNSDIGKPGLLKLLVYYYFFIYNEADIQFTIRYDGLQTLSTL